MLLTATDYSNRLLTAESPSKTTGWTPRSPVRIQSVRRLVDMCEFFEEVMD